MRALLILLVLGGCASVLPGSPQSCAGINDAKVSYNAKTGDLSASICAGKENENALLSGKTPDGLEFSYSAQGNRAFEGQGIRATADTAIMEKLIDKIPTR